MTEFYELSEDNRLFLFKLVYYVGHWISTVDSTGGELSETQEHKALEESLKRCVRRYKKSPFIVQLLKETLERKMHWQRWGDETIHVTESAKETAQLIEENVGVTESAALKILLMEIATYVARAYREYDDLASPLSKMGTKIKMRLSRILPSSKNACRTSLDLLDISEQEEIALNDLAQALGFRTFDNYKMQIEKSA